MTASPGQALWLATSTWSGITPIPEVLMKILSTVPFGTTLVSPVTTETPARSAACPIAAMIVSNCSIAKPSSMISATLR